MPVSIFTLKIRFFDSLVGWLRSTHVINFSKWRLWWKVILYPFVVLSALGLILSLAAHIGALLGLNVPGPAMLLHVGIFIVWIPAVITSNFSLTKKYNRKDFWKVVLRGA